MGIVLGNIQSATFTPSGGEPVSLDVTSCVVTEEPDPITDEIGRIAETWHASFQILNNKLSAFAEACFHAQLGATWPTGVAFYSPEWHRWANGIVSRRDRRSARKRRAKR